jgi:hypothetical protein
MLLFCCFVGEIQIISFSNLALGCLNFQGVSIFDQSSHTKAFHDILDRMADQDSPSAPHWTSIQTTAGMIFVIRFNPMTFSWFLGVFALKKFR